MLIYNRATKQNGSNIIILQQNHMLFTLLCDWSDYSAVCTNKGGHRDTFSNVRLEAPRVSRDLLSRPHATKPQAKREMRSVLCHSLVIDSMFSLCSNVAIHCHCSGEFEHLLLTCIEGCGLQSNRFKVRLCCCMRAVLTVDIQLGR